MSIGPAPNLSGGMATVMQCCAGAFDSGNGSSFTGLNAAKWLNCNCNSTDCSGPGGGGGEGGGGGGGSCGSGGGSGGLVPNMSTSGLRPNDDIICLGTEIITPCGCEPIPFPGSQQTNRLPFPAPGRVSLYPVVGPPGPRMPLPGYPAPGVLPSPIAGRTCAGGCAQLLRPTLSGREHIYAWRAYGAIFRHADHVLRYGSYAGVQLLHGRLLSRRYRNKTLLGAHRYRH